MAEVNLTVSADIQGIKTKLEDLTKSIAEIQSKMGTSMKNAAETSEKAFVDASNTITSTMVNNNAKIIASENQKSSMIQKLAQDIEVEKKALQTLLVEANKASNTKDLRVYQQAITEAEKKINKLTTQMKQFGDVGKMSLGEMQKALRALRAIPLDNLSPKQIEEINAQMTVLTEEMGDAKKAIKATGDSAGMAIDALRGLTSAAQGIVAGMSAMGIETEGLEKAMMNLIGVSQALATIHELQEKKTLKGLASKFKGLGLSVTGVIAPMALLAAGATAVGYGIATLIKDLNAAKEAHEKFELTLGDNTVMKGFEETIHSLSRELTNLAADYNQLVGSISESDSTRIKNETSRDAEIEEQRKIWAKRLVEIDQTTNNDIEAQTKLHNKRLDRWRAQAIENHAYSLETERAMERSHQDSMDEIRNNANQRKIKEHAAYENVLTDIMAKWNIKEKNDEIAIQKDLTDLYRTWARKMQDLKNAEIRDDEERETAANELRRKREIEDLNLTKLDAQTKANYRLVIDEYYEKERVKIENKYYWSRMATSAERFEEQLEQERVALDAARWHVEESERQRQAEIELKRAISETTAEYESGRLKRMAAFQTELRAYEARKEYFDNLDANISDEQDYIDFMIESAQKVEKANKEAYEMGLIDQEEFVKNKEKLFKDDLDKSFEYFDKIASFYSEQLDNQIESLDDYINQREQRIGEIQSLLDAEIQLNKQGFASNIQLYQDQLEQEQAMRDKAAAEREKVEKKQQALNEASQLSNIFTSVTELVAANTKWGLPGILLASAAITAMYALLANAKSQAAATVKFEKGGKGIFSGPSHSQGGIKIGNNMEAQGGEAYYILNKSATNSKGRALMDTLFDAVNGGRVNFDAPLGLSDGPISVEMKEQKEIKEIWKHLKGQKSVTYGPDYRIETFGNVRRTIKNKS